MGRWHATCRGGRCEEIERDRENRCSQVCCSQSEKSFNLITHQKYFRRVRVERRRWRRSTRVSREGRVKGRREREKAGREEPITRTSLLTMANYFLKTATPIAVANGFCSPSITITLETWRENTKHASDEEIVERSLFSWVVFAHRSSSRLYVAVRRRNWNWKPRERVLIKRIHAAN